MNVIARMLLARFVRRRRAIVRAYRATKVQGGLGAMRRLRGALMNTPLAGVPSRGPRFFWGAAADHAEVATRQYLVIRIAAKTLHRELFHARGSGRPVRYPLPRQWQKSVATAGVPVSPLRCTVMFAAFIAAMWAYGVQTIARLWLADARALLLGACPSRARYAFFALIGTVNLPQPGADGRSHDIMTWYEQWPGRHPEVTALRHALAVPPRRSVHGRAVESMGTPTPPAASFSAALAFWSWSVAATLFAALDMLRGRWWHALMLGEAALAAKMRYAARWQLADDYLFNNSGHVYRRLWSYEAEKRGSRILMYFYSLSEQPKLPGGYEPDRDEWGAMNWPVYLVWEQYQADLIRRSVGDAPDIQIVGPIWFQSSSTEMPVLPPRAVAVFDMQPHRDVAHCGLSTIQDVYPDYPRAALQFMIDAERAIRECGGVMVYKAKRDAGNHLHKDYARGVSRLVQSPAVVLVPSEISPARVIEHCAAAVSMPLTSPPLMAAAAGLPSVYYDPDGVLARDDRGAHGIPILSGIDELRGWLRDVLDGRAAPAPVVRAGGAHG